MKVTLVNYTPEPEKSIELAYLACRNLDPWNPKYDKTTQERIDSIWKSQHFSVFEFADATFYISGVSRSCSHQFVRHRMASYGQLSMRHVSPEELRLIVPRSLRKSWNWNHWNYEVYPLAWNKYKSLVENDNVPKEDARFVLPIGIETRFMVKMNFRSWLHFLRLRTHLSAQWEIRRVANKILEHLRTIAPNIFSEDYRELWGYV